MSREEFPDIRPQALYQPPPKQASPCSAHNLGGTMTSRLSRGWGCGMSSA